MTDRYSSDPFDPQPPDFPDDDQPRQLRRHPPLPPWLARGCSNPASRSSTWPARVSTRRGEVRHAPLAVRRRPRPRGVERGSGLAAERPGAGAAAGRRRGRLRPFLGSIIVLGLANGISPGSWRRTSASSCFRATRSTAAGTSTTCRAVWSAIAAWPAGRAPRPSTWTPCRPCSAARRISSWRQVDPGVRQAARRHQRREDEGADPPRRADSRRRSGPVNGVPAVAHPAPPSYS